MNKHEFLSLVWRLEEIMIHGDHLLNQMRQYSEGCDDEDEGLCPACCSIFEQLRQEDERLAKNPELDEILRRLKRACDNDKTGQYKRILEQPRAGKVMH